MRGEEELAIPMHIFSPVSRALERVDHFQLQYSAGDARSLFLPIKPESRHPASFLVREPATFPA
jgi:hypothetical protein